MRLSKIALFAIATFVVITPSAFAQTQTKSSGTTASQTYTGCLMKESDYRKAHNLGGGAVGGVGLGDEVVLVDVKVSPAEGPATVAKRTEALKAVGTAMATPKSGSPCADQGLAYRLTGTHEDKIKGLAGHQLEIQGRFKHSDDAAAGGTRPGEKLPAEVEILSFREAPIPAAVPAPVSEPAPPTTPLPTPATIEPTRAPAAAPATTAPATTEPRKMPHTAGSSALLALIGVLALSFGLLLTALRRRAV